MKTPVRVVTSFKEAKELLSLIYPEGLPSADWKMVGLDTEYTQDKKTGSYVIYYMQISNGKVTYIIDGPGTSKARGTVQDLLTEFIQWLHDKRVKKIISSVRAEYRALSQYTLLQGVSLDTEVGDWILDENRREHGLKPCARDHCEINMKDYADVFGFVPPGKKARYVPNMEEIVYGSDKFPHVPWTGEQGRLKAEKYAGLDPYATYKVGEYEIEQMRKYDLWDWYTEVERGFTLTLIRMEDRGIAINKPVLMEIRRTVQDALLRKKHVFRALVDKPALNMNSRDQLSALFFNELAWPAVKMTKRSKTYPKGRPSLDKEALAIYVEDDYELAKLLQSYRLDATQNSTFLDGIYYKLDSEALLHTVFHQARVVTGRLSSGRAKEGLMNLQNIPAQKDRDPYKIRRLFVPTKKGYVIICGDYSQIELYILAQASGDEVMCRAFNNGEDLHILTACKIFGLKYPGACLSAQEEFKERYKAERGKAKTVNFGLNYGMSDHTLSKRIKVDQDEAADYIEAYFDLYKGVKTWIARQLQFARKHGYIRTGIGECGYYRRVADWINSSEKWEREHAERQVMNSPIQGEAARIIKVAMNAIEFGSVYKTRWFEPMPEIDKLQEWGVEQLLQVHDEIVLQCPEEHADEATKLVEKAMVSSYKKQFTKVGIKASVHHGPTWFDAKA